MAYPAEILLGECADALVLQAGVCQAKVELEPAALRLVMAELADSGPGKAPSMRVHIALERIRGKRDATVLSVSLQGPDGQPAGFPPELRAGSIGLYGLRRASMAQGSEPGAGLTSVLDVTGFFTGPAAPKLLETRELIVSVQANRALSPESPIHIGGIRIFALRTKGE